MKKKGGSFNLGSFGAKVTPTDIALFTRQLATMMKAGVPLVQSFEIVADGMDNPAMRELILKIRDEVSSGQSFAHAIRTQPEHFDDLFCNLVEAGEQSGALETMLDRLAEYKEKVRTAEGQNKKRNELSNCSTARCRGRIRYSISQGSTPVRGNLCRFRRRTP